jgi:hypothetical protein
MCPVCISATALMIAGAMSTVGLAAYVAKKTPREWRLVHHTSQTNQANQSQEKENE